MMKTSTTFIDLFLNQFLVSLLLLYFKVQIFLEYFMEYDLLVQSHLIFDINYNNDISLLRV